VTAYKVAGEELALSEAEGASTVSIEGTLMD
jgi:hypothetical protein